MTERLYYQDSYRTEFEANVVDASADGSRIYLDGTAFYPTSGGQPFDLGMLGGLALSGVEDEGDRIAHLLSGPLTGTPLTGTKVRCQVDWRRRFDHMQQHTGQHLLSAAFLEVLNIPTVSFHLGVDSATIDLGCPMLEPKQLQAVEARANDLVFENRPVTITFEDQANELGLRKASDREGVLRIISINGLDRSACGGTHVRSTGEIGPILLRKLDRVRANVRLEFLCGRRAVRRARADYDALFHIARIFSAQLDETPALVSAQVEKAQETDKALRKVSGELAAARGRELQHGTPAGPDGLRRVTRRIPTLTEDLRLEAQAFASGEKAVMLLLAEAPPAVLLAASKDSGWNSGEWLKAVLAKTGGRGGGSAVLAQASLPAREALDAVEREFGF